MNTKSTAVDAMGNKQRATEGNGQVEIKSNDKP